MRFLDDKIIYALNSSLPTDSFKGKVDGSAACKDLYDQASMFYTLTHMFHEIKRLLIIRTEDGLS